MLVYHLSQNVLRVSGVNSDNARHRAISLGVCPSWSCAAPKPGGLNDRLDGVKREVRKTQSRNQRRPGSVEEIIAFS